MLIDIKTQSLLKKLLKKPKLPLLFDEKFSVHSLNKGFFESSKFCSKCGHKNRLISCGEY